MKRLSKRGDETRPLKQELRDKCDEQRNRSVTLSNPPLQLSIEHDTTNRNVSFRVLQASLAYFSISVGAAILLDGVRRKTLQPWCGNLAGVLAELPILLLVFWRTSLWSMHHFAIPPKMIPRLVISLIAFVLFMLVAMRMMFGAKGTTREEFLQDYISSFCQNFPSNLIGRLLEFVYALMPLIQVFLKIKKRKDVKR